MNFKELLKKDFIIFDGAMGTMLQQKGMEQGTIPETLNFTHPDWIEDILSSYVEAGSDMVNTCTFGANRYKLSKCGYTVTQVVTKAVEVAKKAVKDSDALVALDIGPIGQLLEPTGTLKFEEAYDIFKEIAVAGENAGADLIVFETMTDLYELKAGLLAARENTSLPVICSMSFEKNLHTFTGCSVSSMAITLEGLGADAIGVNCSLGPDELFPVVEELLNYSSLPILVKPNAGLPDPVTNKYSLSAEDFAESMAKFAKAGAKILGGCCGTTPDFIRCITEKIKNISPIKKEAEKISAVCSYSKTVVINQPRIIGERINPTGKKLFKEALKNRNIDYILNQAIEQANAGADILDVNVGLPEIDEKEMMVTVVKAVQGVVDLPLQLDSTIPEVLEAGLRVYNGKAIVNSVNGEDKCLDNILPIIKKYGAAVVGLTLDSNGIPKTAEGRFAIAEKIMNRCLDYGIKKEDIFIDCLTLTVSAEQEGAAETLRALKTVKEKLGLKTVLGVSNISFGLPNRELINRTFLTMALGYGLDLPIINPNIESMTGAVRAYNVLTSVDRNSSRYISCYSGENSSPSPMPVNGTMTLEQAVENGLKGESEKITKQLIETTDPMDIINGMLIPALDKVGERFEKGKIFLPQLILSADTAGVCFNIIKEKIAEKNSSPVNKGKIILATVKGDIHDIGKNIVKVLLENYGYRVIDLGKDVPEQLVVDTAKRENVHLVGLSALMTTTLPSMERTIALLRQNNIDCKVMVGGAVLTKEYAEKIGADYYSKDAKESVDIAKKFFER